MPHALEISTDLKIIGYAHTPYHQRFGVPRQSGLVTEAIATLHILPEFQPELSLFGLKSCSHLWVIYLFHKNPSQKFLGKITPPRLVGKKLGIFATRSPNRPNPIGLSLVKIEDVLTNQVVVSGVDFLDGTPLLDLKPYLAKTESVANARNWSDSISTIEMKCTWSERAKQSMSVWPEDVTTRFKNLVGKTLELDPRPFGYRENFEKYKKQFFTQVDGVDIQFQYVHPNEICVMNLIDKKLNEKVKADEAT